MFVYVRTQLAFLSMTWIIKDGHLDDKSIRTVTKLFRISGDKRDLNSDKNELTAGVYVKLLQVVHCFKCLVGLESLALWR